MASVHEKNKWKPHLESCAWLCKVWSYIIKAVTTAFCAALFQDSSILHLKPTLMLPCLCVNTSATWTESTFPPHMADRCWSRTRIAFIGHLYIWYKSCCVFMRRCCELSVVIVLGRSRGNYSSCCVGPTLLLSFTMTVFYTHSMSVYIPICSLREFSNWWTYLLMTWSCAH